MCPDGFTHINRFPHSDRARGVFRFGTRPTKVVMTTRDNRAVGSLFSDEERRLAARLADGSSPITSAMPALARKHRVHLLLADSLTRAESVRPDLLELTRELRTAAALDAARELHLKALLAALLASGIDALLLKGAALAHMVYTAPHLRPRVDIDLMIRRDALDRAEGVLAGQGGRVRESATPSCPPRSGTM